MTNERPEKIEQEHYSISQINEFARCPRAYYYHRIMNLYMPPIFAMASGKATHAGLEMHNRRRANGASAKVSEIIEVGVTSIEKTEHVEEMDMPLGEAKDLFVKQTKPPVSQYVGAVEPKLAAPTLETNVEALLTATLAGKLFIGYADLIVPNNVFDYKLVGRFKSEVEVLRDPQLAIYSKITGLQPAFIQLKRGKDDVVVTPQEAPPHVYQGVLSWIEDTINQIEVAKQTNSWPRCSPTSWQCSDCPFFNRCFPR